MRTFVKIVFAFFLLIVNLYAQTPEQAKSLMNKRPTEVDSAIQRFIVDNKWELIYQGEKTLIKTEVELIEPRQLLSFNGNSYSFVNIENPESGENGEYFFFDMYLVLRLGKEESAYYNVLNLIDKSYLVVQIGQTVGKRGEKLVSSNRKLLFKKVDSTE